MSDGGKGSSPRPKSVSGEEWANRWDAIFQRDVRKIEDQQNEDEEFEAILKRNREDALPVITFGLIDELRTQTLKLES